FSWRAGNPENAGFKWEPEAWTWHDGQYTHATPDEVAQLKPADIPTAKALDNPVKYAYRTAMLVRGANPYVLIFDDIRKDDAEHRYEWLLQTPSDLMLKGLQGDDVLLGVDGTPDAGLQMLVRPLQVADTADPRLRDAIAPMRYETYEVRRSANSGSTSRFGLGKRLVFSSQSVSPEFKVLLFPHRTGTALPKTTWEDGHARLHVDWDGQHDVLTFQRLPDGRTACGLTRNEGEAFLTIGLDRFSPKPGVTVQTDAPGANVAWEQGTLTVTGTGWQRLTITGVPVTAIRHDGSVASEKATDNGLVLTERAIR
ncbi:MAG TPA: hypothetical protein VGM23_00720, partial [Armatimonadota bacterium]